MAVVRARPGPPPRLADENGHFPIPVAGPTGVELGAQREGMQRPRTLSFGGYGGTMLYDFHASVFRRSCLTVLKIASSETAPRIWLLNAAPPQSHPRPICMP
jgi:hypothetical protein